MTSLHAAPPAPRATPDRRTLLHEQLLEAQFQLYNRHGAGLLLLTTGLPLAGRTETVARLVRWLNPKLLSTHALPLAEGPWLAPCFRYADCVPARGHISIVYDGWYDDFLRAEAGGQFTDAGRRQALASIRAFEALLVADGVKLLKLHVHASRAHLRERLGECEADPARRWRVRPTDLRFIKHYRRDVRRIQSLQQLTSRPGATWRRLDGALRPARLLQSAARWLRVSLRAAARVPAHRAHRAPRPTRRRIVMESLPGAVARGGVARLDRAALERELALQSRRGGFRRRSLAVVLEGMDTAGKSTAVRRIIDALDPRQYRVIPVGSPTIEESARPYLHRFWTRLPEPGRITLYDRSWYGRVLVERMDGLCPAAAWRRAYGEIRQFETDLASAGVILLKFWLSVGRAEQLRRLRERATTPTKRYKLDPRDWQARRRWWDYQLAAEEAMAATDVPVAPWTVLPADDKPYLRLALLNAIVMRLRSEFGPP